MTTSVSGCVRDDFPPHIAPDTPVLVVLAGTAAPLGRAGLGRGRVRLIGSSTMGLRLSLQVARKYAWSISRALRFFGFRTLQRKRSFRGN